MSWLPRSSAPRLVAASESNASVPIASYRGPTARSIAQAADDALLAITSKLDRFRGESRFT